MNSAYLTITTIVVSAICAIAGILVNRHISLRQVKTQEAGSVITNAEYWRKEVEAFQIQITELRKQLEEALKREKERDKKIEDQTKDIELLTFKYYQVMVDKNNLSDEIERYRNSGNRNPMEGNRNPPRYDTNDVS
jgi:peptidoglycan hydrolase CwlO-like protein